MRVIAKKTISLYQKTISPDHGILKIFYPYGCCKYYPTCSEYTYQSIDKYGLLRGGKLAISRLGRCHPWSQGGIDLVPESVKKG
jgi:putative membrane protein insertion efficiency factor